RHEVEAHLLALLDKALECFVASHARVGLVKGIVPVEAAIPGYQQDKYISRGNLRGHPLQNLEHLGVVVENVSGPVRTVEVERQSGITAPRRNVGARLPVGYLERLLHVGKMRTA